MNNNEYFDFDPDNYNMIVEGLYLGSREAAIYDHEKFDIIINMEDKLYYNHIKPYHFKCEDYNYPIEKFFGETSKLIEDNLNENKRVLVHCTAGISRSTTIVLAFLIGRRNFTLENALILVHEKRPCIQPNEFFMEKLEDFEKEIQ